MATKRDKTVTPPESGAPDEATQTISDLAALQASGFGAMAGYGVTWAEALGELGSEVLSFVADRVRQDVEAQRRILGCKDVQELQEVQAEFIHDAIEQYTAETGKIVELSRKLVPTPDPATKK